MTVGENIRKFRKLQGLTQKKLAELSGLNEVTIRSYEAGKYNPKFENIKKIADALGLYITNLIELENAPELFEEAPQLFDLPIDAKINGLKRYVEHEEKLLLDNYRKLNSSGRTEARKRVSELTEIPRYTKPDEPPED